MAKYRVNVLGVQGANNKVYGPIDKDGKPMIVTDEMFPEGNAEKLCKEGKLVKISDTKEDAKAAKAAKAAKLNELQAKIDEAESQLQAVEEALENAEESDKEALQKAVEDAQLALEIAQENFDKA
jgi:ABC-type branched-subunit amino acid transport system substrate-binding protein